VASSVERANSATLNSGARSHRPARVHITGGPGSGKTTLANSLAEITRFPVYHLDLIAMPTGHGAMAPLEARTDAVQRIAASPEWIAEGIHLGWTQDLLESADLIVWLYPHSWKVSAWRIVRRFTAQATSEAARQQGRRKYSRLPDYWRNARELLRGIREAREYETSSRRAPLRTNSPVTRADTESHLAPYRDKVLQLQRAGDVDQFVLAATSWRSPECHGEGGFHAQRS
jgi:adenylate kinase family enzyme